MVRVAAVTQTPFYACPGVAKKAGKPKSGAWTATFGETVAVAHRVGEEDPGFLPEGGGRAQIARFRFQ